MKKFSFENRQLLEMLNRQVIHMDQGVCYCPEYLASRAMRHYPSRVAQIVRAALRGELEPSAYSAEIVFSSVLSGQGERWQNFGEAPDDFLFVEILGRELFLKKGFMTDQADQLKRQINDNEGHLKLLDEALKDHWKQAVKGESGAETALLLDDATCLYGRKGAGRLGDFLKSRNIAVRPPEPVFLGFEYLAMGLVEEGRAQINAVVKGMAESGVRKVVTLSGQSHYVLTVLCRWLDIAIPFEVVSVLDVAESISGERLYVYGSSFYTRYLKKADRLNVLTSNHEEQPVANRPEFTPLVNGEHRVNKVGIWTPPLGAEFEIPACGLIAEEEICRLGLEAIAETSFQKLLVCDPYALHQLEKHGYPMDKAVYYLEQLA